MPCIQPQVSNATEINSANRPAFLHSVKSQVGTSSFQMYIRPLWGKFFSFLKKLNEIESSQLGCKASLLLLVCILSGISLLLLDFKKTGGRMYTFFVRPNSVHPTPVFRHEKSINQSQKCMSQRQIHKNVQRRSSSKNYCW